MVNVSCELYMSKKKISECRFFIVKKTGVSLYILPQKIEECYFGDSNHDAPSQTRAHPISVQAPITCCPHPFAASTFAAPCLLSPFVLFNTCTPPSSLFMDGSRLAWGSGAFLLESSQSRFKSSFHSVSFHLVSAAAFSISTPCTLPKKSMTRRWRPRSSPPSKRSHRMPGWL